MSNGEWSGEGIKGEREGWREGGEEGRDVKKREEWRRVRCSEGGR